VTILRNLLGGERRSVENPLRPLTSASLVSVLGGQNTHSGISVNQSNAPTKYVALYRAITLIAGAIAGLPLEAHRIGPKREPFRSLLLEKPHPELTRMEVWEWLFCSLLSAGHAFALKGYDANDRVAMLEPIAPALVKLTKVKRSDANPWGREFHIRRESGEVAVLTRQQVLHIPGPMGLSPIGVAAQTIGSSIAAEEYTGRLWSSGSLMSGVLQTDQRLDETQAKNLKTRWQEKIGGLAHAHEVAVLDSGAKYQPISFSPIDAQLIESKKFGVMEIARLYGIPPHLLAEVEKSTSWGTGIEQQAIGFVVFTLRMWLTRFEQRISDECLPRGVEAHFHTDPLTLGDAKTRAESNQINVQNGIKSRNEARIEEGLPPVEGGDRFILPMNMTILGDDGAPPPAPEPPLLLETDTDRTAELVEGVRSAFDGVQQRLNDVASREPIINVHQAPITIQPPSVEVHPPEVTVTPPSVEVKASPVQVDVHVPEPKPRTVRKDVEHDANGRITRVTETEE
jgi:HK97 family phage portal protein